MPLSLWWAPADPHLHRRPSNTSWWFWFSLLGVIAPILWVLVHTKFRLCPYDWSLFPPVLWKTYNQIPLALKARFPGDSQSLCWIPRLRILTWGSEPSQQYENFFRYYCSPVCESPTLQVWDLILSCCAAPTILLWLLCLWMWGISFLIVSSILLLMVAQHSCNFGVLAGGDEHKSFYSTILSGKPRKCL